MGKVRACGWRLLLQRQRGFCWKQELNAGRLQGQFAQLDCSHISKWAQGQERLRKCAWAHATYIGLNKQLFLNSRTDILVFLPCQWA